MNSVATRRQLSRTSRLAALLATFALLVGPLASLAHRSLERHHWCDAHGVVEHDAHATVPSDTPSDPHRSPGDRDHDDGHTACSLAFVAPADRADSTSLRIDVGACAESPARRLSSPVEQPSIAPLALAPKTSPPILL